MDGSFPLHWQSQWIKEYWIHIDHTPCIPIWKKLAYNSFFFFKKGRCILYRRGICLILHCPPIGHTLQSNQTKSESEPGQEWAEKKRSIYWKETNKEGMLLRFPLSLSLSFCLSLLSILSQPFALFCVLFVCKEEPFISYLVQPKQEKETVQRPQLPCIWQARYPCLQYLQAFSHLLLSPTKENRRCYGRK